MVVCRCRKATKLYCFVHKAPVCGECISFPEHQLCVVNTYSDWVIDGDYDWPPKCSLCQEALQETDDVTRLGCFHLLHSHCLEEHLRSYPPHTAPAGYMCPSCSTPIWPPKLVREPNSGLHYKLKQIISQSGVATTLLGSELIAPSSAQKGVAPPAFSSSPLVSTVAPALASISAEENGPTTSASLLETGGFAPSNGDIAHVHESGSHVEAETSSSTVPGSGSAGSVPGIPQFSKAGTPSAIQLQNGAMARKNSIRGDNLSPSALNYDDDDGSHRKYSRRGPFHQQVMRSLLPFWSPALPTLPVTAPSYRDKRDGPGAEDIIDGRSRRKQRSAAAVDSRKILLWFAVMSCMATALLLYYRLAQSLGSTTTNESSQGNEQ